MIIEDFAITLKNQSESAHILIGLSISIMGFILALRVQRHSTWSMRRVPYFLSTSGLMMLMSAVPIVSIMTLGAMKSGVLWLLLLVTYFLIFAFGFAIGMISRARSLDGYGDSRNAWMGFVPLINLVLFFKGPHEQSTRHGITPFLLNITGITVGFVLLFFGQILTKAIEPSLQNVADTAAADVEAQSLTMDALLRIQGLDSTLKMLASEVPSQKLDDTLTLVDVRSNASTMRYNYRLDTDADSLSLARRSGLINHNCSYGGLTKVLQAGATIEHFFGRADGTEVGTVTITQNICDDLKTEAAIVPAPDKEVSLNTKITEMLETSDTGAMYRALKGYFPEEAKYMRDSIFNLVDSGAGEEEALAKMVVVGADIRRRHAPTLRAAPDRSLVNVLEMQTQLIAAFVDDPLLCNQIAMFGIGGVPAEERYRVLNTLESVGILFRAMYEGEAVPVQRQPVTENDWANLFSEFLASGGTEADLDLLSEPDLQNENLCGAMLTLLRTLKYANFSGVDRVRAEFVAAMNEG